MVPAENSINNRKMILTTVGSNFKYSPIPPQTPAIFLLILDFLSFAGITRTRSEFKVHF